MKKYEVIKEICETGVVAVVRAETKSKELKSQKPV